MNRLMLKYFASAVAICLTAALLVVNQPVASGAAPPSNATLIGLGGFQKAVFCGPTYLNVEQQRLYVSDSKNNRVQAFIRGNVFQLAFGGYGQNEREFDNVSGICSNAQNLFIVDSANSRVQVISPQGVFSYQFGKFGSNDGELIFPTDIAIHGQRLYVVDTGNNRINLYDLAGKFIKSFGRSGKSDGEFNFPTGLAIYEERIFVVDSLNHRIQIFDMEGSYLSNFGWFGSEEKAFNQPRGIYVDDGIVYVADTGNRRVQTFTTAGVFKDQITYDGFKRPFDVAILENRVIVSDQESNRVFVFEKNGRYHGIFGVDENTNGRFVKPIALTSSDSEIYVLDEVLQNIQIFNENGSFKSVFSKDEIQKADVKMMQSLAYYNSKVYVLDAGTSKVAIFSRDGKYISGFGKYGSDKGEMVLPSDIAVNDNLIFVADTGNSRIQIFDLEGNPVLHFGSYGSNDGQFMVASGITAANGAIYVADTGNSRIQIFNYDGIFQKKLGKRGLEIGSYHGIKGIFVDPGNKVYVADTMNNRIQVTDMLTQQTNIYGKFGALSQESTSLIRATEDFEYDGLPGSFLYPSDVTVFKNYVIVADPYNRRVHRIDMATLFGARVMHLTPSYLDFGSIASDKTAERSFQIHNESGNVLTGKVFTDHAAVTVEPNEFSSPSQEVKVVIDGSKLEDGKDYEVKITVELNDAKDDKIATKGQISLQFKADSAPDFYTELLPMFIASADEDFLIPVRVVPQNGFDGVVSFIALGLPRNTTPTFDPPSINLSERDTTFLKLNPTSRMIEAGIYEIEIETQAARGGIRRRANSTFIYKQRMDLVPHTVLGELFTAIWCINCVHSHTAMNRLYYELGKEKVVWLEYYVQSAGKDEPSPRLTAIDSELRLKWYQSDLGLPTIYFDGTDYLKGLPTGEDTRTEEGKARVMYEAYKAKVVEKLKQPSIVSVGVQNHYDASVNKGKVSATVTALDNVTFRDPRIYYVLTETDIPFVAINGDKEHHFVVRDMLSPLNDDKVDYLGTPMKFPNGETFGRRGDVFTLEVDYEILDIYNISKMSLVVFVQDNVTKTVLQSVEVPVKIINNTSFSLVSDQSLNQKRTKGEESVISSYLINSGTRSATYDLSVLNKSQDKWLFKVYVNGKEDGSSGNGRITLKPYTSAKIEIKTTIPPNAEPTSEQLFTITATSTATRRSQTLNSKIEIVETRPPNFVLTVQPPTEEKIMAGESIAFKINITPDPYFDEEIKLSLRDIPAEIETAVFEPASGKAPFSSTLTIAIKAETPDRDMSLEVVANGTKLSHSQRILFKVERNPDALPPQLEIAYPPDRLITNIKNLEVSGLTDPTATLSINEKSVTINSNGSFIHDILLKEGQNIIKLTALNRIGLQTEIIRLVTLDTVAPLLEIKPLPEEVTQQIIVIEGKTEPGTVLTIDTQDVPLDEEGRFAYSHELLRGFNSIEVVAIDQASNTTTEYLEVSLITLISLRIGSNVAFINHEEKSLDAAPYIKNGRTMVPLRFISEALGAEVEWDGEIRQITLTREGMTIRMRIGSTEVFIRQSGQMGETKSILDAPPEITAGRTFVPLRFISEAFGATLDWNAELREITIKN
jgi:tripartite motif-containing protein 71